MDQLTADKSDLVDEREIDSDKVALTAEKWGCRYFETSAVSPRSSIASLTLAPRHKHLASLRGDCQTAPCARYEAETRAVSEEQEEEAQGVCGFVIRKKRKADCGASKSSLAMSETTVI